jgi:hypothetical protein
MADIGYLSLYRSIAVNLVLGLTSFQLPEEKPAADRFPFPAA